MSTSIKPTPHLTSSKPAPDAVKEPDIHQLQLQLAFELAHFLVRDRNKAIEIVTLAMTKVRVQSSRERKRGYWRSKFLKRKITRIARTEQDMLQWLVYLESTPVEKQQERDGVQSTADMVVRYVKTLAQVTTAMSSFYVSAGLQRLLYNYRTSEAQNAYELLTDLYPNPEAYRKAKSTLIRQLKNRFGNALRIQEGERGEHRIEVMELQPQCLDLVRRALKLFVPWSTRNACSGGGLDGVISSASRKRSQGAALDAQETHWCHAFIDPPCYEELASRAGLDSPWRRLAIPRFYNLPGDDECDGTSANDQFLTENEIGVIMEKLEQDELQRKNASPRELRILADGAECARIENFESATQIDGKLLEGTKLLEVWTRVEDRNVLLATHWIEYTEWQGVARATAYIDLSGGRELQIDLSPIPESSQAPSSIGLRLQCRPNLGLMGWRRKETGTTTQTQSARVPRFAFAVTILFAVASIAALLMLRQNLATERAFTQQLKIALAEAQAAKAASDARAAAERTLAYTLVPDELRERGPSSRYDDSIRVGSQSGMVILRLPVEDAGQKYRVVLNEFLTNQEILSESSLSPQNRAGQMLIDVEVPSSLLQNQGYYSMELYFATRSGAWAKIHTFRFHAVKE